MHQDATQQDLDEQNRRFWDELCGSALARSVGATDRTLESLDKFDRTYMGFYPYLDRYLAEFDSGKVLEIGLGYGTVAQKLAAAGVEYRGLDISAGPVEMVNHRMRMFGLNGQAQVGSALAMPFDDGRFDGVVTIGCLHHTGDIQKGVDEMFRVLKPGGRALVMLYNKFSLRQWMTHPLVLLKEWCFGERSANAERKVRAQYDTNAAGDAAPFTELTCRARAKVIFRRFTDVRLHLENMDELRVRGHRLASRPLLLNNVAHVLGLDWYITATKPADRAGGCDEASGGNNSGGQRA